MGLRRQVVLGSIALHLLGILGLYIVSLFRAPVILLTPTPTIDVRFPPPPPNPAPPARAEPVVSRETPKPARTQKREPERPKPKPTVKATPKPKPKPEATPKPKATQKPKPTEKLPERTSPPPPPQPTRTYYPQPPKNEPPPPRSLPPHPTADSAPALSPSGSKQGALIGVRGGPSLNAYYSRQAIAMIAANFKVPEDKQSEVTCLIAFSILADGRIESPSILRSSGSVDLDGLALEAIRRTERLLPLPDEFRSRPVEAQLTFSFTTTSGN